MFSILWVKRINHQVIVLKTNNQCKGGIQIDMWTEVPDKSC